MSQLVLFLSLALVATSCISSHVTSNKDPFFNGKTFNRFLFVMETGTPQTVNMMEGFAVNSFSKSNLVAVPYTRAIPPVREYTDAERAELLRRANVQAYVRMRGAGVSTADIHIPSVSYTEGSATAYGSNGYGRARGSSATVTAGGYRSTVMTDFSVECEVQDAQTLKTIWTGNIQIDINRQNQYIGANDYLEEAVQLLVKQLIQDGIAR
jgi:hypothetical protein